MLIIFTNMMMKTMSIPELTEKYHDYMSALCWSYVRQYPNIEMSTRHKNPFDIELFINMISISSEETK